MHTAVVPETTETFVIPVVGSNPNVAFVPSPSGIGIVGNELLVDYGCNQGLSIPASNSFGYFVSGFESPVEWAGQHSTSSIEGQDLHFMGVLPESLPYVYHTPEYAYSQSPYTAFVPGIVTGHDSSFTGNQQFYNNTLYPPSVFVQPSFEFLPASTMDSRIFSNSTTISDRRANNNTKSKVSHVSTDIVPQANSSSVAFDHPQPAHHLQSTYEPSIRLQNSFPWGIQSSSQGSAKSGAGTLAKQNAGKEKAEPKKASKNYVSSSHEQVTAYQNRKKPSQSFSNGTPITDDQNLEAIGGQKRGLWTKKVHTNLMTASVDLAKPITDNSGSRSQGNIIINPHDYNKDDFVIDYPDAKFFVIKSYSEDDVHKSIKYNVWSSTSRGNRTLDCAYEDAQRISAQKSRNCPVFLFFSVNVSGQFCGVAEMLGRVDFDKDMYFWQHDKWPGSFPVKWHIIKDVANTSLRHIILPNNENKPVTFSRDTQEIPYSAGISLLKIFKNSILKTSILDDFMFYEERQLKLLAEKLRCHGRKSDTYFLEPAYILKTRPEATLSQCLQEVELQSSGKDQNVRSVEHQLDARSFEQPKSKNNQQDLLVHKSIKGNGELQDTVDQLSGVDDKQSSTAVVMTTKQEASDKLSADVSDKLGNSYVDHTDIVAIHPAKLDADYSTLVANEHPTLEPQKVDIVEFRAKLDLVENSVSDSTESKAANYVSTGDTACGQNKATAEGSVSSAANEDIKADLASDVEGGQSDLLSIDPGRCTDKLSNAINAYDFFTVGSVHINVKGFGERSAGEFRVGIAPTEITATKLVKKGLLADATKCKEST